MVSPCSPADRVFGPNAHSRQVYEEGARDVVLSALTGLNGNSSGTVPVESCRAEEVWGVPFLGHEHPSDHLTSLGSV